MFKSGYGTCMGLGSKEPIKKKNLTCDVYFFAKEKNTNYLRAFSLSY